MTHVAAPSRLHFGLLSLPPAEAATARRFGGVGLMVRSPGLALEVRPAPDWSAAGPLAGRALKFARRFAASFPPGAVGPHHVRVESAPPEHAGLGTGTQLGLAVARALEGASGLGPLGTADLARRVGRGLRSALGIHGFERGGFLVEAGKRNLQAVSPLVARADFPEPWRVILVLPPWGVGRHGREEIQAFDQLPGGAAGLARTETLCRLVLLDMLPALAERDLASFGEAVHQFNRLVGEMFQTIQGGTYSHPGTAELVAYARAQGLRGVGQSSWGPGVFAFAADADEAGHFARQLREHFSLRPEEVLVTQGCNRGATLDRVD
jgi:beta-RFAP synthase